MKATKILALVVPAVAFMATGALATALSKTGEIKSVDAAKHELVLNSGETFVLGHSVKADKLKAGEKVSVSYETKDGKMVASKITVTK